MQRADSVENALMLGKTETKRRRGQQKMRWLEGITNSMDKNFGKLWEIVKDRNPGVLPSMGSQRVRHDLVAEQQDSCMINGGSIYLEILSSDIEKIIKRSK